MPTLAIVHTSFALVEPLKQAASDRLPGVEIINIVDDTLLAYARRKGVDERLHRRMYGYFSLAVEAGADIILSACSSVGETVDPARRLIATPIVKIDEPMAQAAVAAANRIAVLATVQSTLEPTCRLLERTADAMGKRVALRPSLVDGAFDLLAAGDTEGHDTQVTEAALQAARNNDVVLLAQGSMARLEERLTEALDVPLFTSPRLAFEHLAVMFAQLPEAAD